MTDAFIKRENSGTETNMYTEERPYEHQGTIRGTPNLKAKRHQIL